MPIFFQVLDRGHAVLGPAAALEDGVDQALVLRFAVLAQQLDLLLGALARRVDVLLFLQRLVVALGARLVFLDRHRAHGAVGRVVLGPLAVAHLQVEDALEVVDPLRLQDQLFLGRSSRR